MLASTACSWTGLTIEGIQLTMESWHTVKLNKDLERGNLFVKGTKTAYSVSLFKKFDRWHQCYKVFYLKKSKRNGFSPAMVPI